jgi:hypothetical protein
MAAMTSRASKADYLSTGKHFHFSLRVFRVDAQFAGDRGILQQLACYG